MAHIERVNTIRVVGDGSHEVVVTLFFSFEAAFVTVISVVAAHDVVDHGVVVVQLVIAGFAATTLEGHFHLLLVLAISGLLLLLGQFFLLDRKVVDDFLELLGVTVLGKILAQLAEEVLNAVRCRTGVEDLGRLGAKVLVLFLGVQVDWCRLVQIAEELVSEAFLCLDLKHHSFTAFAHARYVLGFLSGRLDALEPSLSLLELLLIVDLIGLFGAFVFFEFFRAFLSFQLGQGLFLLLRVYFVLVVKLAVLGLLGLFFLLFLVV